jgi:signal transduction histidine kinase
MGWALLFTVGVCLAVWLAARHELNELFDETLANAAALMAPAFAGDAVAAWPETPAALHNEQTFAWQVVDGQGSVIKRSGNAPQQAFHSQAAPGYSNTAAWRIFGLALGRQQHMLYVAQTSAERLEAMVEVSLSAMLAAVAMGLLGYGWLRAGLSQELQPIDRLSQHLQAIDPQASAASLYEAERAELRPMHAAVENLSERLAQRVQHERSLAAHAAHALRTPLAGMDAQLAVALADSDGAVRERLQRVRDATGRLRRVVASMITLFRTGQDAQRSPVDVAELAAEVLVPDVTVTTVGDCIVDADADLLAAALANLLDNAQAHGAREVRLECPHRRLLRMSDDGPGIEPEQLKALQGALREQAYERLSGMGLMLADRVARAHDGCLELQAGASGLIVSLRLGPVS